MFSHLTLIEAAGRIILFGAAGGSRREGLRKHGAG